MNTMIHASMNGFTRVCGADGGAITLASFEIVTCAACRLALVDTARDMFKAARAVCRASPHSREAARARDSALETLRAAQRAEMSRRLNGPWAMHLGHWEE